MPVNDPRWYEVERLPLDQWAAAISAMRPPLDDETLAYLRTQYRRYQRAEARKPIRAERASGAGRDAPLTDGQRRCLAGDF